MSVRWVATGSMRSGFGEAFQAVFWPIRPGQSLRWRIDFVRTYLERDIPRLGPRIPAETFRRLWTMLAHQQGGLLNAAMFAIARCWSTCCRSLKTDQGIAVLLTEN